MMLLPAIVLMVATLLLAIRALPGLYTHSIELSVAFAELETDPVQAATSVPEVIFLDDRRPGYRFTLPSDVHDSDIQREVLALGPAA